MASFDDLPDKIILKIFSYLTIYEIVFSARIVCTRWRKLSEDKDIWEDWGYGPAVNSSEYKITSLLQLMPALRKFMYHGTCNITEKLSEYCTKLKHLIIPKIKLSADNLKIIMECLTELSELVISISPTQEGLRITRIIGQSETLVQLTLTSFEGNTVTVGLLKPIADGCPNLETLACESFNCPNNEICYLIQRKKNQLVDYYHNRPVSQDLLYAIQQCTNLHKIAFAETYFEGPLHDILANTQIRNLKGFQMLRCKFPALKTLPLTIFHDTLSQLSYFGMRYAHGNVDELINKIILKCPVLRSLDLAGNYQLRCRGLRNIGSCKMLQCLDVSRCVELGVEGMMCIAEGCPGLELLDVSCVPITEGMFQQIVRCRNLKTLLMKDCDLSNINPNLIPTNIPGLSYLYIGPHFQLREDVTSDMERQMSCLTIQRASVLSGITEYHIIKGKYIQQYT